MHLLNCLNPVRVYNRAKQQYQFVPCGKCDYCRYVRNAAMTTRLKLEAQGHKYCVFGTLTYADMFLPVFHYNEDAGCLASYGMADKLHLCSTSVDGHCVSLYGLTDKDKYLLNQLDCIPYLNRYDFQNFLKRVRINIERKIYNKLLKDGKVKEEEKQSFQIVYALCGEYGPTTYRPHAHFLFYFDRYEIAKQIRDIVRTSWPFGSCGLRFVSNSRQEAQYVAQYVNCIYGLPNYLQSREIRPFLLVSKSHPIGLPALSEEEIQRIYRVRDTSFRLFDASVGKFCEFPLWTSLENQIFPRFSGYNCLDDRERVGLLEYAMRSFRNFRQFYFEFDWLAQCKGNLNESHVLFNKISSVPLNVKSEYSQIVRDYYLNFVKQNFKSFTLSYRQNFYDSALVSLYYCARKIKKNMVRFGVPSVYEYVCAINEYYHKKEMLQLERQFKFEDELGRKNCLHYLPLLSLGDYPIDVVRQSPELRPFLDRIEATKKHTHKNRRKNWYMANHPDCRVFEEYDSFDEGFK